MPATLDKSKYNSYTHMLIKTAITKADVQETINKLYVGYWCKIVTDVWTPKRQVRKIFNATVIEMYKHLCVFEMFHDTGKSTIPLRRCLSYVELAIADKKNFIPVIDARDIYLNKEIDNE